MFKSIHTYLCTRLCLCCNTSIDESSKISFVDNIKDSKKTTKFKTMPVMLKLTLVGEGGVGKSCLILQYMYNEYMDEYEPTKADAYRRTITLQGEEVQVDILDTAGQEDYPAIRDGFYRHGDGFFLVFDVTNKESFEAIKRHRENILRVKGDDGFSVPILIIGNKIDLANQRQVTEQEANDLAKAYSANYIETSALTKQNVDKAFSEILIKIKQYKDNNTVQRRNSSIDKHNDSNKKASRNDKNHSKKRVSKIFQNAKNKMCILS